jgi:hypothetical protein
MPLRLSRRGIAAMGMLALLLSMSARSASVFEFDVWMRAIDQHSVSVQRHIESRRVEAATADARELERLYGLMERYFINDYDARDGAQISKDGRLLAALIPGALERSDFDAAARAARDIALACNDCHDPYKPFK